MSGNDKTMIVAVNELGYRIGTSHHNCTVSDEIIDKIRDLHEDDGMSYRKIAKLLGLSKNFVAKVCRYERRAQTPDRWKRVKNNGNKES
jgi:DNA invertase Pin-like site-specific DNA recombinase